MNEAKWINSLSEDLVKVIPRHSSIHTLMLNAEDSLPRSLTSAAVPPQPPRSVAWSEWQVPGAMPERCLLCPYILAIIVQRPGRGIERSFHQRQFKAIFFCPLPEAAVHSTRLCRWTLKSPASAASQGLSPSPGKLNTHVREPQTSLCLRSSSARRTWLASCPWPW